MLRFRRYRVFLVLAVFVIAVLYHFTNIRNYEDSTPGSVEGLIKYGRKTATPTLQAGAAVTPQAEQKSEPTTSGAGVAAPSVTSPSLAVTELAQEKATPHETAGTTDSPYSTPPTIPYPKAGTTTASKEPDAPSTSSKSQTPSTSEHDTPVQMGQGRHEAASALENYPKIYWTRMPEHFPLPTESLIKLPTGRPSAIPRIQYNFKDETSSARIDREKKRSTIKEAFKFTWTGYKEHAWLHDELKPLSGRVHDPFCGWAATLVDSLDTMWIMGLEDDFVQATNAVGEIEFTTSDRGDIPLFETTIRYLGGLVSAYDLSGGKYKVLLNKAVELADVLMGAFDTPNRMPSTYYRWNPAFASQPGRAPTRTVLAELGSLSMEFTRLAQITKEPRYYDAVARITNELEVFQNKTNIPGLWPRVVDASGCKRPSHLGDVPAAQPASNGPLPKPPARALGNSGNASLAIQDVPIASPSANHGPQLSPTATHAVPKMLKEQPQKRPPGLTNPKESSESVGLRPKKIKRQLAMDSLNHIISNSGSSVQTMNATSQQSKYEEMKAKSPGVLPATTAYDVEECGVQGLASPPSAYTEEFTFGGQADSTYEYLPKQYLLLGGLVQQYRTMYEQAIEAANKHLLIRPMLPNNRDVLIIGNAATSSHINVTEDLVVKPEQEHLLCFAGGMYAVGSKIFGRKPDLDIAAKLTDGCVWSYEATTTGIMPESFKVIPCLNRDVCVWNQTRWYATLDPYRTSREENQRIEQQARLNAAKQSEAAKAQVAGVPVPTADESNTDGEGDDTADEPSSEAQAAPTALTKRQVGAIENRLPPSVPQASIDDRIPERKTPSSTIGDQGEEVPEAITSSTHAEETVNLYPTHEEYVEERIKVERLPTGVTQVSGRRYLLRPEAIESVFIMYRVTGDEIWREKGWKMFNAIQNYTKVNFGYSAIDDVTSEEPDPLDEMESFWLAETLKYFYLLFSPPDVISLDEYVFNTEAHPFRRPV